MQMNELTFIFVKTGDFPLTIDVNIIVWITIIAFCVWFNSLNCDWIWCYDNNNNSNAAVLFVRAKFAICHMADTIWKFIELNLFQLVILSDVCTSNALQLNWYIPMELSSAHFSSVQFEFNPYENFCES